MIERWNRVFEALSAEPRRQLLFSLMDAPAERRVSLPEAAASSTESDVDTLRVELRHHHLPLLSEYGYVRWDPDRFCAQRGPNFEEPAIVLESIQENAGDVPDVLVEGCRRLERERGR